MIDSGQSRLSIKYLKSCAGRDAGPLIRSIESTIFPCMETTSHPMCQFDAGTSPGALVGTIRASDAPLPPRCQGEAVAEEVKEHGRERCRRFAGPLIYSTDCVKRKITVCFGVAKLGNEHHAPNFCGSELSKMPEHSSPTEYWPAIFRFSLRSERPSIPIRCLSSYVR